MDKPVVNIDELEFKPRAMEAPEQFEASFAKITPLGGARQLGYNLTAVPPGKSAFPFHSHRVNEEMYLILQGTGEARIGKETYQLRAGDIIACPAGGPETAHQIRNTGEEELRYLAVSTMNSPEIWEYPDSAKFGVIDRYGPESSLFTFFRTDSAVDYWDGES
jgi:uncharacterized cupin superfamily protein